MSNIKICFFFIAKNHFSFHIPSAFLASPWVLDCCVDDVVPDGSEWADISSVLCRFTSIDFSSIRPGLLHYIGKAALAVFFLCLRLCDKKNIYDSKHGKFIGDFLLSQQRRKKRALSTEFSTVNFIIENEEVIISLEGLSWPNIHLFTHAVSAHGES